MTMTDKELWDAARKEFALTTDSYPTWKKKGFPSTSHWAKGFAFGDQIGLVNPDPDPDPTHTFKTQFTKLALATVGSDASLSFGGQPAFYQQEKAPDRVSIVTLNGEKVIKVNCRVGDNNVAGSGSGERAEIMRDNPPRPIANELTFHDGSSFIIGTEFMIDPTFKSPGFLYGNFQAWNNFAQTHHEGPGQVPWQLNLCTDDAKLGMRLIGGGQEAGPYYGDGTPVGSTTEWHWTPDTPTVQVQNGGWTIGKTGVDANCYEVTKGVWHRLVVSVKFSAAGQGYSRVWVDGVQRFNAYNKKIGYGGMTAYWKYGFYRAAGAYGDSTLYFRDLYSFATEEEALSFEPV